MSTTEKVSNSGRREFINQLGLLASLAAVFPSNILAARRESGSATLPAWAGHEPWHTLSAVQEHLFPAGDDVPGAADILAIVYLKNTLDIRNTDDKDRQHIINGVGWLNDLTQQDFKKTFIVLDEQERETALRKIEQSRAGRRWLSLLLTYLIEALLADPVYGGNKDGAGWKWLQHQPGFPKPPADKTWYKLAAPVSFQRKADET